MNNKKKKTSREELIYHAIVCPLFVLIVLICAYPFYYMFICTISNGHQVDIGNVILLPKGLNIQNYIEVLKLNNISNAAIVSVMRVAIGTFTELLVCAYVGYFFTKQNMWGRKFWYRFVVITMYFSAGIIPIYLNHKSLGLLNTFWVYIIPRMLNVYNMILIKTNIESLPPDLEESAYMDGAGYFTRFFRIVLPLSKPILATTGLFAAVSHWNDFISTKVYITRPKYFTLQFVLYELLNQVRSLLDEMSGDFDYSAITPMGIRMTMTVVVTVPVMLVYPYVQKYYVKGIMIGAVKG